MGGGDADAVVYPQHLLVGAGLDLGHVANDIEGRENADGAFRARVGIDDDQMFDLPFPHDLDGPLHRPLGIHVDLVRSHDIFRGELFQIFAVMANEIQYGDEPPDLAALMNDHYRAELVGPNHLGDTLDRLFRVAAAHTFMHEVTHPEH